MAETLRRPAQLKTTFGIPVGRVDGGRSAVWAGDDITILKRAGSRYFCRVVYGYWKSPQVMHVWIPKRAVR